MKPDLDTPLSDEELAQLEAALLDTGLDDPMDLSTLDGYLCAVLSGPFTLTPAQWMPWVWDVELGRDTPAFASDKEARRVSNLLLRFAREIADTLDEAPGEFEPMFFERENAGEIIVVIADWCFGYVKGMSLDPAGWKSLEALHPEWFEVIRLYGTDAGWTRLEGEIENHPEGNARHAAYVARVTPAVRRIHAHWRAGRGRAAAALPSVAPLPLRRAAAPGRNAPCPCGSGKKYKLCHGAEGAPPL
jgi:uncharacterized protein